MKYTNDIKLQNALKEAVKQFRNYQKNLENKSLIIIYRNRETNDMDYTHTSHTKITRIRWFYNKYPNKKDNASILMII